MSSLFCGVCGKTGDVQVCTGCEEVYYCGRECQLKDWPTHKVRCKQMQARRKIEAEQQKRREEEAAAAAAAAAAASAAAATTPSPSPSSSSTPSSTTSSLSSSSSTSSTPQPTITLTAPQPQPQSPRVPPKPAASTSTLSVSTSAAGAGAGGAAASSGPSLPSTSASTSSLSFSTPSPSSPQYQQQQQQQFKGTSSTSSISISTSAASAPPAAAQQSQSRMDKFTSFMKKKGDSAKKGLESFKDTVGEKTRKLKASSHDDAGSSSSTTTAAGGNAAAAAAASGVAATNASMDQLLAPPKPGDPHAVFGVAFETAIARSATTIQGVPDIMVYALSYLEKSGLDEEGLFRLSGSLREIAKLRGTFQSGEIPPIDAVGDPHVITGLLKLYFRELPEPLFEKKMENPPKSDPAKGMYRPLFDSVCEEFKKPIQLLFWFLNKVKKISLIHFLF